MAAPKAISLFLLGPCCVMPIPWSGRGKRAAPERLAPLADVSGRDHKKMAERPGFEPGGQFYPANRLAGGCLRPLGHLSVGAANLIQNDDGQPATGQPPFRSTLVRCRLSVFH